MQTVFLVTAKNDDVLAWLKENTDAEAQWWGESVVVEHRYLPDLLGGLVRRGYRATLDFEVR